MYDLNTLEIKLEKPAQTGVNQKAMTSNFSRKTHQI